jgi:bacillithiol system protein YtxJ
MNWIHLDSDHQLEQIFKASINKPQVVFKHSTRCNISVMAKKRLERAGLPGHVPFYYLDLLSNRTISNKIAEMLSIKHESPQVLVIKDGKCVYSETHSGIDMYDILENAS